VTKKPQPLTRQQARKIRAVLDLLDRALAKLAALEGPEFVRGYVGERIKGDLPGTEDE
jgi:hypothetical protein